jgi:[protein-PII] uridylyltransferase
MHDYYRHVLSLREVNDILLQHFDEAILRAHYEPEIEPINERFQIRDNYIETRDAGVFRACPPALMELFVIMANRRDISGVRAATIRQVRDHLDLIDETFRNDPNVTRQFIELLRAPYTLVSQLTRMRRYGVLGRYIPEFGRVIGQLQHDLFHIYTVDAHTMMVIRNMRRLHYRSSQEKFPVAYHCVKSLPKIELLYIAGLFHDIAKGRGGDHSTLGAHDVVAFCRRHGLDDEDTELVAWLVRVHLLMSATAQSKDLNDPVVIREFASEVHTERRLDYLYTLTVADINATNPTLWNGWRATLMRQLYMETRKALRRGLNLPVDRGAYIERHKSEALAKLVERGIPRERALALWDNPDPEFFLQHSAGQIVSLTEAIARHDLSSGPLVLVRDVIGRVSDEGATEIFLYTRDQPRLFAASVIAIDQLGLSIQDARIHTSAGSLCFNSYIVLDESGHSISADTARCRHIERTLTAQLSDINQYPELAKRRIPRRLKQFPRPTQAELSNDTELPWSVLRVVASDRPGLLARLGIIFVELGINVHNAKITTLGERVEDLFYITGRDGAPIRDAEQMQSVTRTICERLDQHLNEATLAS